jgi:hypothetical protein
MNSTRRKLTYRRRPARRPPFAVFKYSASPRIRRLEIKLPFSWQFAIIIRKFRTKPALDSKYRQLILEFENSAIREIAFVLSRRRIHRKAKQSRRVLFYLPKSRAAIASLLIIVGLAGAVFFSTNLHKPVSFNIYDSSQKALAAPQAPTKVMPRSLPVRLQIPKIGVDNQLSQVGLQANGQMEMPWDIETAAWYKYSPTPGELGPSVIVGHLDGANYANIAGIFYRLHELVPGDEFSVIRADGSVANFKVLRLEQVPQNNFPTQEIYGNINYAGIRLITCGGTFNQAANHYTDNTVVFAALE